MTIQHIETHHAKILIAILCSIVVTTSTLLSWHSELRIFYTHNPIIPTYLQGIITIIESYGDYLLSVPPQLLSRGFLICTSRVSPNLVYPTVLACFRLSQ